MRQIVCILFILFIILTSSFALAGDQLGVYISPKFVGGTSTMKDVKGHWADYSAGESGNVHLGNKKHGFWGGSIAFGYDFSKNMDLPFRAELEYSGLSETEAKTKRLYDPGGGGDYEQLKQTFSVQTLFVNAYWDIDTGTQFTPYAGAGLGLGFIKTKLKENGQDSDVKYSESLGSRTITNFAWNLGAGVGYDFNPAWTMDLGYRFVGLGSVKTKTYRDPDDGHTFYIKSDNLYHHQFSLGVRYTF